MRITDTTYFSEYLYAVGEIIRDDQQQFLKAAGAADLSYQISASAVYSSNIEGNRIDLNSFMNYQLSKEKFKAGKELKESKT